MRYTWSSIPKGFLLSLLVILFICPQSTWAGTTGKIAGVISDESTRDPLVGANVFLDDVHPQGGAVAQFVFVGDGQDYLVRACGLKRVGDFAQIFSLVDAIDNPAIIVPGRREQLHG